MKCFAGIVLLCLPLAGCLSPSPKVPDQGSRLDEAEINRRVEASIIKRQKEEDVARTPGFESTIRSGSEVMKIALAHVRTSGTDLSQYRAPTITLLKKEGGMKWLVSWDLKGMPMPGGFFGVLIDDQTGAVEDVPGM